MQSDRKPPSLEDLNRHIRLRDFGLILKAIKDYYLLRLLSINLSLFIIVRFNYCTDYFPCVLLTLFIV